MALIHLDAGVVIGLLDAADAHHSAATALLAQAIDGGDRLAMSAAALAECLVGPARRGPAAIRTVESLVERLPIEVVSFTAELAVVAASLRAGHRSLRLPDAIVIATAAAEEADILATTDRGWPSARALRLPGTLRRL